MEYYPNWFNSILEAFLSNTHPNFLRSFGEDEEHNYITYENYSQPLEDYVDVLKQTGDFDWIYVPYIGQCRYIHPGVWKLLRSILKYLRSRHDKGTSLDGFAIENIYFENYWRGAEEVGPWQGTTG